MDHVVLCTIDKVHVRSNQELQGLLVRHHTSLKLHVKDRSRDRQAEASERACNPACI